MDSGSKAFSFPGKSSSTPHWSYDVFLSFRGEDTRKNFIDHLYEALVQSGINTFIDSDRLLRGAQIAPERQKAIKESRIAIVVFSENYASSSWCLRELENIMDCKKITGQSVLPVFYDVDPSDVWSQRGPFEAAFVKHEKRYAADIEEVKRWRSALKEVASLSGFHVRNSANGSGARCIKQIVEYVLSLVPGKSHFRSELGEDLIGIEPRKLALISLLGMNPDELSNKSRVTCVPSSANAFKVLLSCSQEDSGKSFAARLGEVLSRNGIITSNYDGDFTKSESPASLLEASEETQELRIHVVVFSKKYISSSQCLDDLVEITNCNATETFGQVLLPIFYDVDPSEIWKETVDYWERYHMQKVEAWKKALAKACSSAGWYLYASNWDTEEIIQDIFQTVSRRLAPIASSVDVHFIGITGLRGSGKTTIVQAVYDQIHKYFEVASFINGITEASQRSGLLHLQELILSHSLLAKEWKEIDTVYEGAQMIRKMLCSRKVLIVLDDVDNVSQLEALAGERMWFGEGSRIIITSSDKHVLRAHGVKEKDIHNVRLLEHNEAIQLFSRYAFPKGCPSPDFKQLADDIVCCTGGLPWALKVLGSKLCNRFLEYFQQLLIRIQKGQVDGIYDRMKISYEELNHIEKELFLDIACFFRGWEQDEVIRILDSCGFYADVGMKILEDKSLISISDEHVLLMNEFVQGMGRHIVYQECPTELANRSRLWHPDDISSILASDQAVIATKAIVIDDMRELDLQNLGKALVTMKDLRLLYVKTRGLTFLGPICLPKNLRWLTWDFYSLDSLPTSFQAAKLVGLQMHDSSLVCLWKGTEPKVMRKLRFLDLSHSENLETTPDFGGIPNLERLNLEFCSNLVEVHESIRALESLVYLNLRYCKNLQSFPPSIQMKSLEILDMSGCSKLKAVPEFLGEMVNMSELHLRDNVVEELPSSIGNLPNLVYLDIRDCENLKRIPDTICSLKCLKSIKLHGCLSLRKLPWPIRCLEH